MGKASRRKKERRAESALSREELLLQWPTQAQMTAYVDALEAQWAAEEREITQFRCPRCDIRFD